MVAAVITLEVSANYLSTSFAWMSATSWSTVPGTDSQHSSTALAYVSSVLGSTAVPSSRFDDTYVSLLQTSMPGFSNENMISCSFTCLPLNFFEFWPYTMRLCTPKQSEIQMVAAIANVCLPSVWYFAIMTISVTISTIKSTANL